jgi:hypothetical protein
MIVKIRNTKPSWQKHVGTWVELFEENSDWDGSPEFIRAYVVKITEKGVWFSRQEDWANDNIYWVAFKKIKGYWKYEGDSSV